MSDEHQRDYHGEVTFSVALGAVTRNRVAFEHALDEPHPGAVHEQGHDERQRPESNFDDRRDLIHHLPRAAAAAPGKILPQALVLVIRGVAAIAVGGAHGSEPGSDTACERRTRAAVDVDGVECHYADG